MHSVASSPFLHSRSSAFNLYPLNFSQVKPQPFRAAAEALPAPVPSSHHPPRQTSLISRLILRWSQAVPPPFDDSTDGTMPAENRAKDAAAQGVAAVNDAPVNERIGAWRGIGVDHADRADGARVLELALAFAPQPSPLLHTLQFPYLGVSEPAADLLLRRTS